MRLSPEIGGDDLPEDAPLLDAASWRDVLAAMSNPTDANSEAVVRALASLIETLAFGLKRAGEVGDILLRGRSLAIWERALTEGPPEALDVTLASLDIARPGGSGSKYHLGAGGVARGRSAAVGAARWAHLACLATSPGRGCTSAKPYRGFISA